MPSCIARSVYSAKHMHELFLRRMIAVPTMVTMVKLLYQNLLSSLFLCLKYGGITAQMGVINCNWAVHDEHRFDILLSALLHCTTANCSNTKILLWLFAVLH